MNTRESERRDTEVQRESWFGIVMVVIAIITNIATKVINFSIGEYSNPADAVRAVLNVELGLIYAVCAVIAWRLLPTRFVGWLMLLISLLWQAGSWLRALYDVGWLWPIVQGLTHFWAIFAGILVFCYPSGRLVRQFDRVVLVVALSLFSVRFVSTLLLGSETFDGPRRENCICAPNAWAIIDNPALAGAIESGWRLAGLVLIIIVAVRMLARWIVSSPPARRIAFIMPVALLLWMIATLYENTSFVFDLPLVESVLFLTPLAISAIPIAFLAGIVHIRNLRARVSDLVVIARDGVDRTVWQRSLQRTLDDPSLRVCWWDDETGRYLDSHGEPSDPNADGDTNAGSLLSIDVGDRPIAVIRHDIGLTENTKLLEGVAAALRLSVDNVRLRHELEKTLQAVRESRLRIVEAGDTARRRIERDLHDGSQQLLVSVAINLRMAGDLARSTGNDRLGAQLEDVSVQLAAALADLRALARGIHPTSLTEGGLQEAIRELAARCPVPVEALVEFEGRESGIAESTVYFVVAECLTNTAKYAEATGVSVVIALEGDTLTFRIADNGVGTADASAGSGLHGLIDRVEALGGHLRISSEPTTGTVVSGSIPRSLSDPDPLGKRAANAPAVARHAIV